MGRTEAAKRHRSTVYSGMSSPGGEVAAVGVLTVSDRASSGEYEDKGGPAVSAYVSSHFAGPLRFVTEVVPDEQDRIAEAIKKLASSCDLVLTTGGTGPAPRDVTPEATMQACSKLLPGFGEQMRMSTVAAVPTAILARQTAGVCGTALVINLPGSVKAIPECLDSVLLAIPHAVRLVEAKVPIELQATILMRIMGGSFVPPCDGADRQSEHPYCLNFVFGLWSASTYEAYIT